MAYYHPIMGICIFLIAIFFSFLLGKSLVKRRKSLQKLPPRGEITSPDAPWIEKK